MRELDDHTTDDLFKAGAERHDFGYNPEAWSLMEGMLDEDLARQKRFRRLLGLGAVLVLLLIGGTWAALALKEPTFEVIQTEQNAVPYAETPVESSRASEDVVTVPSHREEVVATTPSATTSSAVEGAAAANNTAADASTKLVGERNRDRSTGNTATANETVVSAASPNETRTNGAVQSVVSEDLTDAGITAPQATNNATVAPIATTIDPVSSTSAAAFPAAGDLSIIAPSVATTTPRPAGGVTLGLSAGTVIGSVEGDGLAELRPRLGLTAAYRLPGDKVTLGTGAFFNSVCYRATGEQYTAKSADFWADGVKPDEVIADCNILEIPVSVSYYPYGTARNGFFATGGLTSYFLLREDFDFNYPESRPGQVLTWQEKGTNRHIFGAGQLSLGYQRATARRGAFQFEGFVQLPLTGIGQGSVNLFTVGASVNYQFSFNR